VGEIWKDLDFYPDLDPDSKLLICIPDPDSLDQIIAETNKAGSGSANI